KVPRRLNTRNVGVTGWPIRPGRPLVIALMSRRDVTGRLSAPSSEDRLHFPMAREQNLTLPPESPTAQASEAAGPSADLEAKLAKRAAEVAHLDVELIRARAYAANLARDLEISRRELQWMLASTSWRVTRPLRMLATGSPKFIKYGRRLANSLGLRNVFRADRRGGLHQGHDRA